MVILMTIIATYLSMFAVDDSFDAIQIKCDPEVSRGAFVFVDKCKPVSYTHLTLPTRFAV